jgi:hypothetical protein
MMNDSLVYVYLQSCYWLYELLTSPSLSSGPLTGTLVILAVVSVCIHVCSGAQRVKSVV